MFKKYKIIGGKRYGPYLYESKRVGDKVLTNYIGKCEEKTNKLYLAYILIGIVLVFGVIMFVYNLISPTGKVTIDLKPEYAEGEKILGSVKFSLQQGELIPADSKLIVKIGGEQRDFLLSEVISREVFDGNFYAEGVDLRGQGRGYGLEGEEVIYPELDFSLSIYSSEVEQDKGEKDNGNEGPIGEPIGAPEEQPSDTPSEMPAEIPAELLVENPEEQPSDTPSEMPETLKEIPAGAEVKQQSKIVNLLFQKIPL